MRRMMMVQGGAPPVAVDNYAYLFSNSISEHVNTNYAPNFTRSFSISFKFKLNVTNTVQNFYGLNGNASINLNVQDSTNRIRLRFGSIEGQNMLTLNWTKDTNWHSIEIKGTGKFSGSLSNITVLMDGQPLEITTPATYGGKLLSTDVPLTNIGDNSFNQHIMYLGVRGTGTLGIFQEPLNGWIADFEYKQGPAASDTMANLANILFYECEERIGTTVFDSSGNGNHGIMTGNLHAVVTGTGTLPTNSAQSVGYLEGDNTTIFLNNNGTSPIPVGVFIPANKSSAGNSVAYLSGGTFAPLATAGSGGGSGGGGGGGTGGGSGVITGNYIVSNTGSNTGAGTLNDPISLSRALELVQPGQVILMRGGEYNMSIASIGRVIPTRSGSVSSKITLRNYGTEVPVLTNCGGGSVAIVLTNINYWDFIGITLDGKGIYNSSNIGTWVEMKNSKYNRFLNCNFKYAKGWYGFTIETGSDYNIVRNCWFDYCGTLSKISSPANTDPNTVKISAYMHINGSTPEEGDAGDSMWIGGGKYNLIERCKFTHGGHDTFSLEGSFNIVRYCIFDSDWNFHRAANSQKISSRTSAIEGRQNKNQSGGGTDISRTGGFNVIEYNIFKRAYWFVDNTDGMSLKLRGNKQIFRFNAVFESYMDGISITTNDAAFYSFGLKIYNNIIAFCNWSGIFGRHSANAQLTKENVVVNNIFFDNDRDNRRWDGTTASNKTDFTILDSNTGTLKVDNNYFMNNCVFNKTRGNSIILRPYGNSASIANYQSSNPTFVSGNIFGTAADPKLLSWPATDAEIESYGANFENIDIIKIDPTSPCKNAARHLTTATNTGTNSSTLVLADASYFTDGMNVPDITGDMIKIGSETPVRILLINHTTNTVTLAEPRTWTPGTQVRLVVNNNVVVNNIGIDQL